MAKIDSIAQKENSIAQITYNQIVKDFNLHTVIGTNLDLATISSWKSAEMINDIISSKTDKYKQQILKLIEHKIFNDKRENLSFKSERFVYFAALAKYDANYVKDIVLKNDDYGSAILLFSVLFNQVDNQECKQKIVELNNPGPAYGFSLFTHSIEGNEDLQKVVINGHDACFCYYYLTNIKGADIIGLRDSAYEGKSIIDSQYMYRIAHYLQQLGVDANISKFQQGFLSAVCAPDVIKDAILNLKGVNIDLFVDKMVECQSVKESLCVIDYAINNANKLLTIKQILKLLNCAIKFLDDIELRTLADKHFGRFANNNAEHFAIFEAIAKNVLYRLDVEEIQYFYNNFLSETELPEYDELRQAFKTKLERFLGQSAEKQDENIKTTTNLPSQL